MRVNVREVETNVTKLVQAGSFDLDFIYKLLLAYGKPPASITRLKSGTYNLASDKSKEIYWNNILFFRYVEHEDLHSTIDDLKGDPFVGRHNPRFIIVTDFEQLLAIDTKTQETLDIRLDEIDKHFVFFLPWAGMEKSQHKTENIADVKAAERMAKLYDEIIKHNESTDPAFFHALNVFFSRLLFCFFAEDTEVFEKGQFTDSIASHTQPNGSDLNDYLDELFKALDVEDKTSYPSHIKAFPYVNGGLFNRSYESPNFNNQARKLILECGELDWAQINPDIFGSMIQAVVHPGQRAGLGMHYTSVINIMKVIEPLFLEELLEEFDKLYDDKNKLQKLLGRLYKIKVFDPACGSGNFLIIAYKELRKLEHRIIERINELSGGAVTLFQISGIQLENFYGIEIDDFAHEVAILSLWLAKHQMNIEFKAMFNIEIPLIPLTDAGNIVCDNATRIDWNKVCPNKPHRAGSEHYRQSKLISDEHEPEELIDAASLVQNEWSEIYIIGNPPYLGSSMQDAQQKRELADICKGFDNYKNLDYISIWFIKAADYIKGCRAKSAFVSTNSICQGEQVALLWPHIFNGGVEIGFAHTSFKWSNSAKHNAGVTCVIVGLVSINNRSKRIYTDQIHKVVPHINAYLAEGSNIVIPRRGKQISNLPEMIYGNKPTDGGFLILSTAEKDKLLSEHPTAKQFIKVYMGADELLKNQRRYCLWVEDNELKSANLIPEIKARLENVVRYRNESKAGSTSAYAIYPNRFKQRTYKKADAIIIPSVTSERRNYLTVDYVGTDVVISNRGFALYGADAHIFGILSSRLHAVWVRAVAGRLETRINYSSTICYNNFPVPQLSEKQKQMISNHSYEVIDARERHSEKTLAELYDPDSMPDDLLEAHRGLDEVVELCYRTKPFDSDEDRLAYLFKLYEIMAATQKELI